VELPLESVPNFSEGRDRATIDALAEALSQRAELLDVHSDPDHNRAVFTLVGGEEDLRVDPPLQDEREVVSKERIGDVDKDLIIHGGVVLRGAC